MDMSHQENPGQGAAPSPQRPQLRALTAAETFDPSVENMVCKTTCSIPALEGFHSIRTLIQTMGCTLAKTTKPTTGNSPAKGCWTIQRSTANKPFTLTERAQWDEKEGAFNFGVTLVNRNFAAVLRAALNTTSFHIDQHRATLKPTWNQGNAHYLTALLPKVRAIFEDKEKFEIEDVNASATHGGEPTKDRAFLVSRTGNPAGRVRVTVNHGNDANVTIFIQVVAGRIPDRWEYVTLIARAFEINLAPGAPQHLEKMEPEPANVGEGKPVRGPMPSLDMLQPPQEPTVDESMLPRRVGSGDTGTLVLQLFVKALTRNHLIKTKQWKGNDTEGAQPADKAKSGRERAEAEAKLRVLVDMFTYHISKVSGTFTPPAGFTDNKMLDHLLSEASTVLPGAAQTKVRKSYATMEGDLFRLTNGSDPESFTGNVAEVAAVKRALTPRAKPGFGNSLTSLINGGREMFDREKPAKVKIEPAMALDLTADDEVMTEIPYQPRAQPRSHPREKSQTEGRSNGQRTRQMPLIDFDTGGMQENNSTQGDQHRPEITSHMIYSNGNAMTYPDHQDATFTAEGLDFNKVLQMDTTVTTPTKQIFDRITTMVFGLEECRQGVKRALRLLAAQSCPELVLAYARGSSIGNGGPRAWCFVSDVVWHRFHIIKVTPHYTECVDTATRSVYLHDQREEATVNHPPKGTLVADHVDTEDPYAYYPSGTVFISLHANVVTFPAPAGELIAPGDLGLITSFEGMLPPPSTRQGFTFAQHMNQALEDGRIPQRVLDEKRALPFNRIIHITRERDERREPHLNKVTPEEHKSWQSSALNNATTSTQQGAPATAMKRGTPSGGFNGATQHTQKAQGTTAHLPPHKHPAQQLHVGSYKPPRTLRLEPASQQPERPGKPTVRQELAPTQAPRDREQHDTKTPPRLHVRSCLRQVSCLGERMLYYFYILLVFIGVSKGQEGPPPPPPPPVLPRPPEPSSHSHRESRRRQRTDLNKPYFLNRRARHSRASKQATTRTIRLCFININHLLPRWEEVASWLEGESARGKPTDVLMFAEPVLPPNTETLPNMPFGYKLAPANPPSTLVENQHLSTAILFRTHAPDVTYTDDVSFDQHLGLSFIEMITMNEPFPSIFVGTTYLPNRSRQNTAEYTTSLVNAIISSIKRFIDQGAPVILALDCNCTFKEREKFPPSQNSPMLRRLLDEIGGGTMNLVVLNWVDTTTGFYTRWAAHQAPSQLDLILVTPDIAHRCRLQICKSINFDSDHCLLNLEFLSRASTKAKPIMRTKEIYVWENSMAQSYQTALAKTLATTSTGIAGLLSPHSPRPPTYNDVVHYTNNLTSSIATAYSSTVPHRTVSNTDRPPRPTAENHATATALIARERARKDYMETAENVHSPKRQQLHELKQTYETTKRAVRAAFAAHRLSQQQKTWGKMEETFDKDKAAYFREFTKLLTPHRDPLPRTVRVNAKEIRRPGKVISAWTDRFRLTNTETGSEEDKAFRKRITQLNKERATDRSHEDAVYNTPIIAAEVYEQLKRCQNGKKPGDDQIQNEMLRRGGKPLIACLVLFLNLLMRVERAPAAWKNTPLEPMHKRGDRLLRENYRPIGYGSNLYKLYERVLDARIRAFITLPLTQCGFRPKYGPLTALVRAKIITDFCLQHKLDLYIVNLDFKQAFEQVWREGILHRLWELNIRGKLWRIIKDQLTATRVFVRTNYGDGTPYQVHTGIVQGSVLAALLFIIFISPLSQDLAGVSPTINNTKILPLLFADDGNLYHIGRENCKTMIKACQEWANKWNIGINLNKTKVLSMLQTEPTPLFRDPKLFELVTKTVTLGVGLTTKGIYSIAYLRLLLKRFVSKIRQLMDTGVRLGALRTDMGLHIFTTMAESILKYSLPLVPPASHRVDLIDHEQSTFALNFLGLTTTTPPHAAKAELGLIDYDLRARRDMLLLYHRIVANKADTLTNDLLTWPSQAGMETTLAMCSQELHRLSPTTTWHTFSNLPYKVAKHLLKDATRRTQEHRWEQREQRDGHLTAHAYKSKLTWGLDKHLLHLPPLSATHYIHLRNGAALTPAHYSNSMCYLCKQTLQSELHLLWSCTAIADTRRAFRTKAQTAAPQLDAIMGTLTQTEAFHFIMGAGTKHATPDRWRPFLHEVISYTSKAFAIPPGTY